MSLSDAYIASDEQRTFDSEMSTYDCWGSQAHVIMLRKVGIINEEDAAKALHALVEIEDDIAQNGFAYDGSLGAQLSLEKLIVDRVGEHVGLQVHTGRSRNDQVLVTQKLYVRDRILELLTGLVDLIALVVDRADAEKTVIMPGYTHMQPARPTTVGQWFAMYADEYLRDAHRIKDTFLRHNTSPLGAADSYGTSWPLDRTFVAELLAFDRVDEISIEAISSRGESDTDFLADMSILANHVSRASQDMLLCTTFEYGYAQLTEAVAQRMGKLTGSSIMPQKKNPDALELLRAQASEIHSYLFHCLELAKALPMGYNRDLRDTKGPILRGIRSMSHSIAQMQSVVMGIAFNEERMLKAVTENYCMATDLAEWFSQRCNIPFRVVHRIVGNTVREAVAQDIPLPDVALDVFKKYAAEQGYELNVTEEEVAAAIDPRQAVQRRKCLGGPSVQTMNEWYVSRKDALASLRAWVNERKKDIQRARTHVRALAQEN